MAGMDPGGVFKSTDAGNTWSDTGLVSGGVFALAIDPLTPSTVYAGTDEAVFDIEQVSAPPIPTATPTSVAFCGASLSTCTPTVTTRPTQIGFCGEIEATCTPTPTQTNTATPCDAIGGTCTPTVTPAQTVPPVSCVGDCDGGGTVTVDEIITMVRTRPNDGPNRPL